MELRNIINVTRHVVHKIIIETCYLTDEEKIKAALLAVEAGALFIKTSTGFGSKGASVADVALLKDCERQGVYKGSRRHKRFENCNRNGSGRRIKNRNKFRSEDCRGIYKWFF